MTVTCISTQIKDGGHEKVFGFQRNSGAESLLRQRSKVSLELTLEMVQVEHNILYKCSPLNGSVQDYSCKTWQTTKIWRL